VDHEALIALQRQGAALESEPGGQKLGVLVHAVLAALPSNRPDLVEDFVRYAADQQGLDASMRRRAVGLVHAALANDSVRAASSGSHWQEVPFAKPGPAGIVEGAIDMFADEGEGVTVLEFKTDAVAAGETKQLERLYSVQLAEYLEVARSVAPKPVNGQLIFLASPGGRRILK
jgi:ATP-dependent exoDNAse (exonuclease V) beta subunit